MLNRHLNLGQGTGRVATEHYNDVVISVMAFQITELTIVYSAVYSGADQRKHQSSASMAFVRGIHHGEFIGEFPAERASNAENVSISWRYQECPPGLHAALFLSTL